MRAKAHLAGTCPDSLVLGARQGVHIPQKILNKLICSLCRHSWATGSPEGQKAQCAVHILVGALQRQSLLSLQSLVATLLPEEQSVQQGDPYLP